jgi:hypothetical protein
VEGAGTDILAAVNADIETSTGHITLLATRTIELQADVDVATATSGTIMIDAQGGALTMAGTANVIATNASIRLNAAADVTIGNTTAANVSILSGANIVNAAGSTKNVTANNLRLEATGSIGTAARHLSTDIDQITAQSTTGSIFITEDDAATVTDVEVTVYAVMADATVGSTTDAAQSDLQTLANGDIVLVATLGDITLNDGVDADGHSVDADGTGNILIDALAGSITANSDILSDTGHITLKGGVNVDLTANVDVLTGTAGTISIDAETGALTMDGTANVTASDSSARLTAALDVTLGNVTATNVSILSGANIVNAANSTKNVTATNLRLSAVGSIGVAGRHVTTNIDTLSASAATGSIFLTEDNGATVTDVTVTVTDFNSDATTTSVTDLAQSDLMTGNQGDIVLVASLGDLTLDDGADLDDVVLSANGGNILLEATNGAITGNADVLSTDGSISLVAQTNVIFNTGADMRTGSNGSIDVRAQTGFITFATDADQTTALGDIRFSAQADITLGGTVTSAGSVSLISVVGAIVDGDLDAGVDVIAAGLRVAAVQFGRDDNAIETDLDQFAATVDTGAYLDNQGALVVGSVDALVNRVGSGASTAPVTDAALTGVFATSGDVVITSELSITLETIQTTGDVWLTATQGAVYDGGDAATDVLAANLSIVAEDGVGTAGLGGLELDVATLDIDNSSHGSVYVNLLSSTTVTGMTLSDYGSIFIHQTAGDLTLAGPLALDFGRVLVTTVGELTIHADLTATDDIRLVANALDVNAATLTSSLGDIEVRSRNDADFDSSSLVHATQGDIDYIIGGEVRLGDLSAGGHVTIRARGDILRNGGEITATNLKLYSQNGQIGANAADPVFTNVDRIDVSAAGEVFISEADSIEFGRNQLSRGGEGATETITFKVGSGTVSSVSGDTQYDGNGTLVIESTGDVTLATGLTATNGNIAIVTGTLTDGTAAEDILLEAVNGRVSITATGSVGGAAALDIDINASEVTTTTASGTVVLELRGTTTIVGNGVTIASGSGELVVNHTVGNLTINARVAQYGAGRLDLDTVGTLTMTSTGRIITGSGAMDVFANGNFFISQVSTGTGTIRLQSATGSVDKIGGFSQPNVVSVLRADVFVAKVADFVVQSDSVRINGVTTIYRSIDSPTIVVALNFG